MKSRDQTSVLLSVVRRPPSYISEWIASVWPVSLSPETLLYRGRGPIHLYLYLLLCFSAMSIAESSKFPGYAEETSNGSGNSPMLSHSNSANSGFSRSAATGTPRPGSFSQQNNSQLHLWIPKNNCNPLLYTCKSAIILVIPFLTLVIYTLKRADSSFIRSSNLNSKT